MKRMEAEKPRNTDKYIAAFPKESQIILEKIRNTIKKTVPKATETISYGMPAFKLNGKPLVYFGGFENHIGLYALPSGNEAFKKKSFQNIKLGRAPFSFRSIKNCQWI